MKSVMIADDHLIVAQGIASLLESTYNIVAVLESGEALLEQFKLQPVDIVITDVSMSKMTGIALTQSLCSLSNNVKVICLSMHNEREYVDSALKAGAVGYILKNKAGGELRNALLAIEQGKTYLTKELTSAPKSDKPKLSKRQQQVLQLLVKGMKAKDIGEHLFISHRTVEFHKYAIMRILGANNSAELTRYAIKLGFVDDQ